MIKKSFFISTLILGGLVTLGSFGSAYALFSQPASNASFGISQEVEYYLKGSFNDWAQNNSYKFVNNTAGMSLEENKIKEYKLENIPLAKDATLKVWANNDVWYKDGENNCSYEHVWSNATSFTNNDDHNYIVPMTSNTYSFYLKLYSDGSSKLYVTANKDILYFIPNTNWAKDSATFAIRQYEALSSEEQNTITTSVLVSGAYKFEVGTTYPRYRFIRRDSTNSSDWNYSAIATIGNSDTNNCFELWDEFWGGGAVPWDDWHPNGGSETGVSNGEWSTR